MEVDEAFADLSVAEKAIVSTEEEYTASKEFFEIIKRKYEEGISSQFEYMDAQTRLTNADIKRLIAEYDYYIKLARLESVTSIDTANITLKPESLNKDRSR